MDCDVRKRFWPLKCKVISAELTPSLSLFTQLHVSVKPWLNTSVSLVESRWCFIKTTRRLQQLCQTDADGQLNCLQWALLLGSNHSTNSSCWRREAEEEMRDEGKVQFETGARSNQGFKGAVPLCEHESGFSFRAQLKVERRSYYQSGGPWSSHHAPSAPQGLLRSHKPGVV